MFVLAALVGFALNVAKLFPFTTGAPLNTAEHCDCSSGNDLRVLSANVHVRNRRVDELLRFVDRINPDLVLLMETDAWWHERPQALRARWYPYVVPHSNCRPVLLG